MTIALFVMTLLTGIFLGAFLILSLGIYLENRGWEIGSAVPSRKHMKATILKYDN